MITVSLLGMDAYEAIDLTKDLGKELAKIYDIAEDEIEFYAPSAFIIHNGVEQTSFRLNVEVEAPFELEDREEEIKNAIIDGIGQNVVHLRILFRYFDPEHEYMRIDDDYPLHMNENNMVKVNDEDDDTYNQKYMTPDEESEESEDYNNGEEPYMGDIISEFDSYVKEHPDATNEEIYQALSDIRNEVSQKHANDDR